MVERRLAKAKVAGSIPVSRSKFLRGCWNWQTGKTKDLVVNSREGSSPFSRIQEILGEK